MESISRLSNILETARDLTLEAAQSASSTRGIRSTPLISSSRAPSAAQTRKLLDSRNDRDVLEGLRRVISVRPFLYGVAHSHLLICHLQMSYQPHASPSVADSYFSSVVKTITSPSLPVKKLVYIYLVLHAESNPDLALLSINAIQKSLTDKNFLVRAMALRVMSGIRVPVISQIVALAIKKGSGDMSPLVRRTAALAIPKCYRLDPASLSGLVECLGGLLGDRDAGVIGAAVMAYMDVCPERLELIHPVYRALLGRLVYVDEWGQLAILRLMVAYGRKCFPLRRSSAETASTRRKGFYDDDDDDDDDGDDEPLASSNPDSTHTYDLDPDHLLLLTAIRPLLQSRNSAVVVAVARVYLYLLPPTPSLNTGLSLSLVAGPLISLLQSEPAILETALPNIIAICLHDARPFVRYATHFLLRATDAPSIARSKIEILTLVFPHSSPHIQNVILAELDHSAHSPPNDDLSLVRDCVRGIGRCAQESSDAASQKCFRLLLRQLSPSPSASATSELLVVESLTVLRHLIQASPALHRPTVTHLARHLDRTARHPAARASVIWLVGEFAALDGPALGIAPDVLRILLKSFPDEPAAVKAQILLLAARVYLLYLSRCHNGEGEAGAEARDEAEAKDGVEAKHEAETQNNTIPQLWRHVLLLVRYDTSYDLRDRARLYKTLLPAEVNDARTTQLATLLLLAPKPAPRRTSPSAGREGWMLGSTSLVVGEAIGGGEAWRVEGWVREGHEPDRRLRDGREEERRKEVSAADRLEKNLMASDRAGKEREREKEGGKTLDDWLAESDEEESERESESEDTEEEETSSEEETSEEDDDSPHEGEEGVS